MFEVFAGGHLACDAGLDRIWAGYKTLGEVHAFDLDGRLLWIARLPDFVYPVILENDNGRVGPDPSNVSRIDVITHLSLIDARALAVQVESRELLAKVNRRPEVSYRTYLLDAQTGREIGVVTGRHRILAGGRGAALVYREMPVPEYAVVSVGVR